MRILRLFYSFCIVVLVTAAGCSNVSRPIKTELHTIGNPDAEEVLTLDPEADIFQFEGVIYKTGIDWVENLSLTKDEQVGEIKTRNETDTNFVNEMSNKLPVGAKIFSTKEKQGPILLVESEGEILKYFGLVEG
ncbi:hypothetical protein HNO89_004108 [Sporosarcina luteola]|nr:hypothetical protein [Sporosarcina luteola]